MHIRLYFVCFLFVFSSCSNNQVSVKNEKEGKLNSTYQLMVSDEKKIALDSETPTRPPYMQIYTDSTGNRLLTFLNSYKNSIYFYDYDNSSYQKKIVYNREGSDAIMRVAGYYIKSPDSIYVYNMPMTEVDLTDSMGKVKNRISLRTNEPDWPDRYPQYWLKTVNPFIRIGNKIYLTGQTFRSLTMSNIMNFKFCYIIFCTIICFIVLSVPTFAKENSDNVIRVGSFEETYNVVNEKGERSGYGYEYLQDIAGYAGWTYKYITSDWKNCFTQLENGEIDILGGISYTDERAENMLFSDMPMGEEKYYIYTDASNMDLTAGNLDSFEGKNIGVFKDNITEDVLNEWELKYGLHTKHINVSTTTEIMDKLSKHEIDCFVSVEESRWEESDISPITSIGETEIYFAINPERPDIKEALDSAMRRIKDDNPFYTDDLYRRYLSAQSSSFLSKEESEWIGQHGAIRIGYLNQDGGISSVDPSTGKLTGVITDYVDLAENCLQGQTLEFELNGYETRSELLQALQDGKIDLIFHANQNPYFAETNGFALSDTLLTLNMAAITAKDSFDENKENIVAVEKDDFALKAYLSYNYPQWKVVEYETSDAAVKAMQKGETDCIVSNSGTVSDYLKNNKLHSVFLTKEADVPFAIQQGEPVLLSILNKTLTSMPTAQFSGAVVSYNASSRKVTAKDFIQDNLLAVSLIVGISILVVLCIILDSLKKSKRAEEKSKKSAEQALKLNQELEEKQQELQNALVEAQSANKAKTSFLNNMSHDIRTPINGIMLTILEKSGNDGERAKDCLNKINESSKLLLSLVNDVLDMAKLESDTVVFSDESINLDQVCQEITESLSFQAEEKGLHVIGEHDDYSGIYVWSNAVHLKKILMNLFTNSMKYNKVNGFIYMSMRTIERSEDHMTCEFKIRDNGIGMSEEFIKNELFTPFVQADNSPRSDYNGTGLGMPIVKQLVEKMGGTITVESKLGEGSCFTVILPFKIDTNARPEEKEDFDADISDIRVLLVEDNELNVEIAEFMLTENGAKVETVNNGLEAVQHFEASEPGTYDVILMDVMMPVMDGLTAARTIRDLERQDAKTIPIIAMTANAFREDAEKCMEAGMNAHLAKPLDDKTIKQTICEELRSSRDR